MHAFYDYQFKTDATKKEWKHFMDNIDERIRLAYRGCSSITVIINFKKCFNITPYTLRHSKKVEHANLRKFALYLLVHYSKDTLDDIANDFNMSIDELQSIKSNQDLDLEYEEKIKMFFEPLKEDFKECIGANLAFCEVMLEVIDKGLIKDDD